MTNGAKKAATEKGLFGIITLQRIVQFCPSILLKIQRYRFTIFL